MDHAASQLARFLKGASHSAVVAGAFSLLLVLSLGQPLAAEADPSSGGAVLVSENFTGTSVADSKFVPLGSACITGAAAGSSPAGGASTLSNCDQYQVGAVPTRGTGGSHQGWLQLTDASGGNVNNNNGSTSASRPARSGGVLYNQSLPATAGLHIQFEQAQYGGYVNATNGAAESVFRAWGADGISFFLTDGNYNLAMTGASGGSLGYAQKVDSTSAIPGVVGGFLGLGLDAWGNFSRQNEGRGTGCSAQGLNPGLGGNSTIRNSLVLRGAGWQTSDSSQAWTQGYCLTQTSQLPTATQNLREPWNATLAATDHDTFATNATRWVDVEISPVKPDGSADVTVQMKFSAAGAWATVLTANVPGIPTTYKFGMASSTGNAGDVHLIRNVVVKTVNTLTGLGIVKGEDVASPSHKSAYAEGDQIPYNFTVTNYGVEALTDVQVVDPLVSSIHCPATPLSLAPVGQPGATVTCTGTHTVTAAEATDASGQFTNTAYATGTSSPGNSAVVSDPSTETVPLAAPVPGIVLTKTGTADHTPAQIGDTITYGFSVRNSGNVTLAPVTISDSKLGLSDAACVSVLAPGATATCAVTGTHVLTEADVVAGAATATYVNTATAIGTPPGGLPDVTDDDTASTPIIAAVPGIVLTKTGTADHTPGQIGDTITYGFSVRNSGNVTLAPVTISDSKLGLSDAACVSVLAPGATATCAVTGTHVLTEADILAGSADPTTYRYANTATATGTAPGGLPQVNDDDTVATPLIAAVPGILLNKASTVSHDHNPAQIGDTISYTFTVTNTGNVTLAPVTVTDVKLGISGGDCVTALAPGDTATCSVTGSHVVTNADIEVGDSYDNTATASGTDGNGVVVEDGDDEVVPLVSGAPLIKLVKTGVVDSGHSPAQLGDSISYSFAVTNTGNVTLEPVTISDPTLGISEGACVATLAPGVTTTCTVTGTHTLSQADVMAGSPYRNTATATGVSTAPTGPGTATDDDDWNTPLAPAQASIVLTKSASPEHGAADPASLGDVIAYTFSVRNSGNVTLAPVTISDPKLGISNSSCTTALDPGETKSCTVTGTHTITSADLLAGSPYTNTATATGVPPSSSGLPDARDTSSTDTVLEPPTVGLTLRKTAVPDHTPAELGDSISYTFEVTNAGNVTLAPVTITDPKLGISAGLCVASLAPGDTSTCTVTGAHTVTETDLLASTTYDNVAAAQGVPPAGSGLPDAASSDTATVPLEAPIAELTLRKTAVPDHTPAELGDSISYTFEVTNAGNVTLAPVTITDPKLGISAGLCVASLAPGDTSTCTVTGTHVVTEADLGANDVNTAVATGMPPAGSDLGPVSDQDVASTPTATPVTGLTLDKKSFLSGADAVGDVGDVISYTFTVRNSGSITLTDVVINDATLGVTGLVCAVTLAPGDSADCTSPVTRTIGSDDIVAGRVDNTATADGTSSRTDVSDPGQATDSETVYTRAAGPGIGLVKHAELDDKNDNGGADAGEVISYSFTATNTGNVSLAPVSVSDPMLGISGLECAATLAPAESVTCPATATHTVTEEDLIAGKVTNLATVTGTPPASVPGPPPTSSDDAVTPATPATAGLSMVKKAKLGDNSGNGSGDLGEKIAYTFTVTNSGTVTLTGIVISDPLIGAVTCPQVSLAPGESMTCRGDQSHVVTASDVAAGTVDNTATVSASSPPGVADPKPATDTVSVVTSGAKAKDTSTPRPSSQSPRSRLAATGAQIAGLAALSALLLGGGSMLAIGARRRRKNADAHQG